MPLKKFGKSFKLDVEKEIMPYQLYTQDNIERVYVSIFNELAATPLTLSGPATH